MQSKRHYIFASNKTTGGSTGQAITIRKNTNALARERVVTWMAYKWAGIGIGDVQARFWGVPITRNKRFVYRLLDFISNRVRLSAFNLTTSVLEDYYDTINAVRPAYLYGYVSIIAEFANFIKLNNLKPPSSLQCIITTSEILHPSTRNIIEWKLSVHACTMSMGVVKLGR